MENEISIAIVGGGVVGCAVACEISRSHEGVFVFEKNPGITQGENQSSRNSGVIHSGIYYDRETRPRKADLCVKGNRLLYDFCSQYQVPALKTGKLMVATTAEEEDILDIYLERARQNRVPGVEKIPLAKVKEMEPNVSAKSALNIPSAGIVEPTALVYRLYALASGQGVVFMTDTELVGLGRDNDSIWMDIRYRDGKVDRVWTRTLINAAGIDADRLARMINSGSAYELDPVRGESYKFYTNKRPDLKVADMNVYPTPEAVVTPHGSHFTVGIHLTPTFGDLSYPPVLGSTVTVGPKLVAAENRNTWNGNPVTPGIFIEKVNHFFPGLREEDLIWHQAGLQARLKGHPDFVITPDPERPNFINLLGIDSPGLTSCLAIAREVKDLVEVLG